MRPICKFALSGRQQLRLTSAWRSWGALRMATGGSELNMDSRFYSLNRRDLLVRGAALASVGLAIPLTRTLAQDASPEASPEAGGEMPPIPEGATVVGQGLWNPGDLTV